MTPIPPNQLVEALEWRYATQVFDPTKMIPAETWAALEASLILTPSSYGLQPWKFVVITDRALREKLVPLTYRQRQVVDSSHLVVMCVKKTMDEEHVDRFLQRIVELRGGTGDSLMKLRKGILGDIVTGERSKFVTEWAIRQAYIALGQFIASCAVLGVDSCPMEGFRADLYDEELGLAADGYTATVLCPAGYRSENDRYATLPKVRFASEHMIKRHD
jgi:nitroreductase